MACEATTGGDANGSPSPSAADPTFLDLAHVALSPHLDEYLTPTSITRSIDLFDPWDPDVQLPYGFDVDPDLEIAYDTDDDDPASTVDPTSTDVADGSTKALRWTLHAPHARCALGHYGRSA
jgi:hypothetical protein